MKSALFRIHASVNNMVFFGGFARRLQGRFFVKLEIQVLLHRKVLGGLVDKLHFFFVLLNFKTGKERLVKVARSHYGYNCFTDVL